MVNKPTFWKTFQALAKIRQEFVDEFYYKLVAYHAYHFFFKNEQLVKNTVLYGIDPALQDAIYSDQVLGMDSVSKLHYWFKAYGTAPGSWSYDIIMENFKDKNVALTDAIMQQIIG